MAYTMGQAARATGISKPRLSRAIKAGKISAERQEDGSYTIDPAELHRVYPATVATTVTMEERGDTPVEPADTVATWQRENELLREMLGDLQRRLDREGEERRQAQTQLMALLADRRPWWRRFQI